MDLPVVKLHHRRDKRVKAGHPWVFSNEIDGDVSSLPPGGAVRVTDSRGKILGHGYANPKSLIAVRLLSQVKDDVDHPAFYGMRMREALAYRQAVYPGRRDLRLVSSEADQLPGLVVDRFGDIAAVQITTLGMEVRKPQLEAALKETFGVTGAVLRSSTRMRELEGLPPDHGLWFGEVPDTVEIEELGVRYGVSPTASQKTGHFYDQAENRAWAGARCGGLSVLDVYANTGGWALHALVRGAKEATTIDSDAANCGRVLSNAQLNGVAEPQVICGEARKTLHALVGSAASFGAVVLDPPAFAKTRKTAGSALRGYAEINGLGIALVQPGGWLFTSSCSHHILEDRFLDAVVEAASQQGRQLRLARRGEQAPDHPVLPGVPESRYLKSYAFQVR